jgi:hypothetical protein
MRVDDRSLAIVATTRRMWVAQAEAAGGCHFPAQAPHYWSSLLSS